MTDAQIVQQNPWWLAGWSTRITPSSMGRAAACIRSEAMPHTHSASPFARKGSVAHKFLADCLEHGRDLALGMVEDVADIDWLSAIDVERLPAFEPQAYHPEVALAYDPSTRGCRALGKNLSREQAHGLSRDGEIVGVVDVLGATEHDAIVQDYKCGWGYVEPAEVNWQLRTYAVLAARYLRKSGAVYSVIRVRDNGSVWWDTARMDELDLLGHEEALLELLERRNEVRALTLAGNFTKLPPLVEGRHCRYCPAFAVCPAKAQSIQVLGAEQEVQLGALDHETAARAWHRLKYAQKALDRYEAVLKDFARQQGGFSVGNGGDILGERETVRETIIPERARGVLEKAYGVVGGAVAGEATESSSALTKKALKTALKRLVLPTLPPGDRKITSLNGAALKLLREGGAVSAVTTRCVTEWTPKAQPDGAEEDSAG
jgi:hypothetical protein